MRNLNYSFLSKLFLQILDIPFLVYQGLAAEDKGDGCFLFTHHPGEELQSFPNPGYVMLCKLGYKVCPVLS
ncbi:hypothetical protein CEE35_08280 [Candidatus Aerophobetes bacterium Ae_b3b]|nr:MAG: hypothetical protein CEE35_08280 [Candidatus Aerophobetes bacterium Ae_b3b]